MDLLFLLGLMTGCALSIAAIVYIAFSLHK